MTGISIGLPVFLGLVLDILFEGRKKKKATKTHKKKKITKHNLQKTHEYNMGLQ